MDVFVSYSLPILMFFFTFTGHGACVWVGASPDGGDLLGHPIFRPCKLSVCPQSLPSRSKLHKY